MSTALFFLRCKQLGLSFDELEDIEIGLVNDMYVEQSNDEIEWPVKATQEDFENFKRW
jgi:hypothetical protein